MDTKKKIRWRQLKNPHAYNIHKHAPFSSLWPVARPMLNETLPSISPFQPHAAKPGTAHKPAHRVQREQQQLFLVLLLPQLIDLQLIFVHVGLGVHIFGLQDGVVGRALQKRVCPDE